MMDSIALINEDEPRRVSCAVIENEIVEGILARDETGAFEADSVRVEVRELGVKVRQGSIYDYYPLASRTADGAYEVLRFSFNADKYRDDLALAANKHFDF